MKLFLSILSLLTLFSCRPFFSSHAGNVHRNTSHKNYKLIKEKAVNYLKAELGQQIYDLRLIHKSKYTYLEMLDTIYSNISVDSNDNIHLSNDELYFCCSSHMNIAFQYQIEGNNLLHIDLKYDQFGNLDTLKSISLSNYLSIIKSIEKNGYSKNFKKLDLIARNHGIKGKFNYSLIENKSGIILWKIIGSQTDIKNGQKYQSGILIKVEDLTKTELIEIKEIEFGT
jgi:hypothetical protein